MPFLGRPGQLQLHYNEIKIHFHFLPCSFSGSYFSSSFVTLSGGRAPCKICGEVVAVGGSVEYFRPVVLSSVVSVYTYNSATNKLSELPRCPNCG